MKAKPDTGWGPHRWQRSSDPHPGEVTSGTGALCPEAQADGVPCGALGRDCEVCSRAAPRPWRRRFSRRG